MAIADASESVLVPAIGAGSGMVMGKRFPGCPVRAIVLAHSSPSPFTEIGSPTFPMVLTQRVLFKALLFCQDRGLRS